MIIFYKLVLCNSFLLHCVPKPGIRAATVLPVSFQPLTFSTGIVILLKEINPSENGKRGNPPNEKKE